MRQLACLVLFAACAVGAQRNSFQSDFGTLAPGERVVFLQSICPGHDGAAGCDACPPETSFPQDSWKIESVIFGHFRSATSNDAILSGRGCEPHAAGQGGSYVFTRDGSQWRLAWYRPGYPLSLCKKLPAADGRDLLICEQSDMHQGVADTFLYLLDPRQTSKADPEDETQIFLGFDDSLGSCVKLPDGTLVTGKVDSVDFTKLPGKSKVRITVKLLLGSATIPDRVLVEQCDGKGRTPVVTTVPRGYQFLFDGQKVLPMKGNPKTERAWAIPPRTSYRAK